MVGFFGFFGFFDGLFTLAAGTGGAVEEALTPHAVLVGYDGSPVGDLALAWAADVAGTRGEVLRVLVVAELLDHAISTQWPKSWAADIERHARAVLHEPGHRHLEDADFAVEHRVGAVVPTLVEASATASMLVLGSRGHSMVGGVMAGSVSQGSARRAHSPVVVVRPVERPDSRRVVVGVDGSESSLRALDFAAEHARATGQSLAVLRARRTAPFPPVDERGNVPAELSSALLAEEQTLEEDVATARERFPDLAIEGDFIATAPGDALVEASRRASLVVLGARSRHPVVESVLGSVSRHVLHQAHCPVGVVR
jgi:nucleotide-binding universal stress UspA family protein